MGVDQQCQRRAQPAAALEHRIEAFIIHIGAMKDQIDACPRRIQRCFLAAGVGNALLPEPVGLRDVARNLLLVKGSYQAAVVGHPVRLQHHVAVHRELDDVDAVFDLHTDLLDRLVGTAHDMTDRCFRLSDPGGIIVGEPLAAGHIRPGGGDARTLEQTGIDGIAHRQRHARGVAGIADRRIARQQHALRHEHCPQRAEFDGRIDVDVFLALGVAVGEMGVKIDKTG